MTDKLDNKQTEERNLVGNLCQSLTKAKGFAKGQSKFAWLGTANHCRTEKEMGGDEKR